MWIKMNINRWEQSLHSEKLQISLCDDIKDEITIFRYVDSDTWTIERRGANTIPESEVTVSTAETFREISAFAKAHSDDTMVHHWIEIGERDDTF